MKNDWITALGHILNDYQNHQGTWVSAHQEAKDSLEILISGTINEVRIAAAAESYRKGYIAGGIAVAVSYRDHTTNKQITEMEDKLNG
jgi:hypothetical protein